MNRLALTIHGSVQGVNFRWYTREHAAKLELVGFVRNRDDATVEVVAEGDEKALNALKEWCCAGPKYARVERCEEKWEEIDTVSLKDFTIAY